MNGEANVQTSFSRFVENYVKVKFDNSFKYVAADLSGKK